MLDTLNEAGNKLGLSINIRKTKVTAAGKGIRHTTIKVRGHEVEWVEEFVYFGSMLCADRDVE